MHMARPPQQDFGHPGVGSKDKESWPQRSPASLEPKSGGGVEWGARLRITWGKTLEITFWLSVSPL